MQNESVDRLTHFSAAGAPRRRCLDSRGLDQAAPSRHHRTARAGGPLPPAPHYLLSKFHNFKLSKSNIPKKDSLKKSNLGNGATLVDFGKEWF